MEEEEAAAAPGANILQPLLTWLSKPQAWFDPAFEEDTSPLTEAEQVVHDSSERLGEVLRGRTLALCFNSWRVYLATSCFLREEEAEKAALVISLWRATTSGLLDARASAQASVQASAMAGVAGILGLYSDDDEEEDD